MNDSLNKMRTILMVLTGVLGGAIGELDSLLYGLIVLVALDYLSGVLAAIHNKKVSSNIGYKGIIKKIMIFVLVAMGNIVDQYLLKEGSSIKTMFIIFYISNEAISITENAAKMGIPLPKKIKEIFSNLNI